MMRGMVLCAKVASELARRPTHGGDVKPLVSRKVRNLPEALPGLRMACNSKVNAVMIDALAGVCGLTIFRSQWQLAP